jgi:hypothetical protein
LRDRTFVDLLPLLACFAVISLAVALAGMPLNHDCALLLQCGRLVTEGSIPYVDHVESNLHMAQYIHAVPVLLSNALGIHTWILFPAGVLLLTIASALSVYGLLGRTGEVLPPGAAALTACMIPLLSMWVYLQGEFGQREHLFLLVWVPFLLLRLSGRRRGPSWTGFAVLAGFLTGIMMLCKPTFLALVLLTEGWILFRTGNPRSLIRTEMVAMYCALVLFGLHLVLLPGGPRSPFFTLYLPMLASGYGAYNVQAADLIRHRRAFWACLTAAMLLAAALRGRTPGRTWLLLQTLLVASVLALLSYILQHKGWQYQLIPAFGLSLILLGSSTGVLLDRFVVRSFPRRAASWLAAVLPAGLCAVMAFASAGAAEGRYDTMDDFLRIIEEHSEPGDRIAVLSTCVYPKYPTLEYAGRMTGTRFLSVFPVAVFYRGEPPTGHERFPYHSTGEQTPEERRFLEELGSDITTLRPALVFIDTSPREQALPLGFRFSDYLDSTGWMDGYMAAYRQLCTLHGFAVYEFTGSSQDRALQQYDRS